MSNSFTLVVFVVALVLLPTWVLYTAFFTHVLPKTSWVCTEIAPTDDLENPKCVVYTRKEKP